MSKGPITYTSRPDATPKAELDALSHVYAFVLEANRKKEAAHPAAPDARKESNGSGRAIIQ